MRPTKQLYFSQIATVAAKRSTCVRRAVGCVIVNSRGHILGTGYNGVAAGLPHCNEDINFNCKNCHAPAGQDGCEAVHAEVNAILQCDNVWEIDTVYVTLSPCLKCTKMLLNTSAKRIVFLNEHDGATGEELWQKAGREWLYYYSYAKELLSTVED